MSKSTERDLGKLEGKMDGLIVSMGELTKEVAALRGDFGSLEKGRLSTLEVAFARFEAEVSTKARTTGVWWGLAGSVFTSVTAAILLYFILK